MVIDSSAIIAILTNEAEVEAIEPATEPLIHGLNTSNTLPDPSFDVQEWNQQRDEFEARMKQEELAHEVQEQHLTKRSRRSD